MFSINDKRRKEQTWRQLQPRPLPQLSWSRGAAFHKDRCRQLVRGRTRLETRSNLLLPANCEIKVLSITGLVKHSRCVDNRAWRSFTELHHPVKYLRILRPKVNHDSFSIAIYLSDFTKLHANLGQGDAARTLRDFSRASRLHQEGVKYQKTWALEENNPGRHRNILLIGCSHSC